jgi:dihydrofolate reductase
MQIGIVVAMSRNRVIGKEGTLPWRLKADLARFTLITTGHPVIMGRKTFESILTRNKRPLPKRPNIIITRMRDFRAGGDSHVTHSLDEALSKARLYRDPMAFVIGGAEIFSLALPRADRIFLTIVETECEGDVFFPKYDLSSWSVERSETLNPDHENEFAQTFTVYRRPKELDLLAAS